MSLVLEPVGNAQLVFNRTQQSWLLLGRLSSFVEHSENLDGSRHYVCVAGWVGISVEQAHLVHI